jgi:hypothetical protein
LKIDFVYLVIFHVKNVQEIPVINAQNVKMAFYFIKANVNQAVPQGPFTNFHKINMFLVTQIVKLFLIKAKHNLLNVFYLISRTFKPIYVNPLVLLV